MPYAIIVSIFALCPHSAISLYDQASTYTCTFLNTFDQLRDTEVDALLSSAMLVVMAYSRLCLMLHVVRLPKA